jgi:alcohol oxidase
LHFSGTKATGVEWVYDRGVFPNEAQTVRKVAASKQVIVAAGAMNSPLILERSGIGAASVLSAAGITKLVDLPGVGENYNGS